MKLFGKIFFKMFCEYIDKYIFQIYAAIKYCDYIILVQYENLQSLKLKS